MPIEEIQELPDELVGTQIAFKLADEDRCERASCYARANLPRTVPKSYWSWPVAICKGSIPTYTVVSPNTGEVHVPQRLYTCLVKTEVPDWHVSEGSIETKTCEVKS